MQLGKVTQVENVVDIELDAKTVEAVKVETVAPVEVRETVSL